MQDKIKEAYSAVKSTGLFLDENDFREQIQKAPKDVFSAISDTKLFLDYDDFETSLGIKKKVSSTPSSTQPIQSSVNTSQSQLPSQLVSDISLKSAQELSQMFEERKRLKNEYERQIAAFKSEGDAGLDRLEGSIRQYNNNIADLNSIADAFNKQSANQTKLPKFNSTANNVIAKNDRDIASLNLKKDLINKKVANYVAAGMDQAQALSNATNEVNQIYSPTAAVRQNEYDDQLGRIQNIRQEIFNATAGDKDARESMLKNFEVDFSGISRSLLRDANKLQQWQSQGLNPALGLGLDFIKVNQPERYGKIMQRTMAVPGSMEAAEGKQINDIEVERIGINLLKRGLSENIVEIESKIADAQNMDPDSIAKLNSNIDKTKQWIDYVNNLEVDLFNKYPEAISLEVKRAAQDIDKPYVSKLGRFGLGLYNNTIGSLSSTVGALYDKLFLSGDELVQSELKNIADQSEWESLTYKTQNQDLIGRDSITVIKDDVKNQLKQIDSDNSLDETQKRLKKESIILQAMKDQKVYSVINPSKSRVNLTSESVLNTFTEVMPQIVGFFAMSAATGGLGNISKARQLYNMVGVTMAQSYGQRYDQAVMQGSANPHLDATVGSAIDAFTEAGIGNNLNMFKKVFTKGAIGRVAQNLTKADWDRLIAGKTNSFKNVIEAVKTGGKNLLEESIVEEGTAQALNNLYEGKDVTEGMRETFLTMGIGMLPLTVMGIPMSVRNMNTADKMFIYSSAFNIRSSINAIDDMLKNGDITPVEASQRKKALETMNGIINKMPMVDANGNPLSDENKARYAFNEYVKQISKTDELPKDFAKDINTIVSSSDKENSDILQGATPAIKPTEGQELSNLESGTSVDAEGKLILNKEGITANSKVETDKIKSLPLETGDGVTMNLDGTVYTGKGMIVPAASMNTTQDQITPEMLADFMEQHKGKLGDGETFKVGYYKFPNSNQVSIDLSIVVDPKNKEAALKFGEYAGQESLYDMETGENIKTGADGSNPKQFTDEQFVKIAKDLKAGKVPFISDLADELSSELGGAAQEVSGKVAQALKSANVKVLELSSEEYSAKAKSAGAQENDAAFFDPNTGEIVLNKETADNITVIHEGAHPVMNIIYNTNRELYDQVVAGMKKLSGNKGIAKALAFGSTYDGGQAVQDNEALVEAIAMIGDGQIDINSIPTSLKQRVIDLINSIGKLFGFKIDDSNALRNDQDVKAFRELASKVADTLKSGQNISSIVGEENVGNWGNKISDDSRAQLRRSSAEIAKNTEDKTIEGLSQPSMVLTGKKKGEDVDLYTGPASIEKLKEVKPAMYVSRAEDLAKSDLVQGKVRMYPSSASMDQKLRWADNVYKKAKDTVVSNLLFVFDSIPSEIRDISKLWYDGANIIAQELSSKYGITLEQASAVIATQSPQKPWYDNVHLAHFVIDFFSNKKDMEFTQDMFDYYESKSKPTKANPKGYPKQVEYLPILKEAIGKKFSDLSNYDKSVMIRADFDNNYERRAPLRIPTGVIVGRVNSMSSFSGYETIAKAVSVLEDGSEKNISDNLGGAYKVRNFYNNIANPKMDGEVTIDTHAMAAAYLLPLGSSSPEVKFDEGTYSFFADAYRDAAAQRGVLAREMQSIVWEGVRSVFPASDKSDANKAKARDIWSKYKNGSLPLSDVQNQIKLNGKDLSITDWSRFTDRILEEDGQPNYIEELPLSGRSESSVGFGDGSSDSGGFPGMGEGGVQPNRVVQARMIPEDKQKKLTDDGKGNFVFFHYSDKKLNKIDPSKFGKNLATGRDERPGVGISMYYVDNKTSEPGVPNNFGYAVRVPKDKVYPINEDPMNFYDQAKKEFEKDYPGQAFDANKQVGYITKVAGDNGFDMTITDWNIKGKKALRAQTTKPLKPEVYKSKVFRDGFEREQFNEELDKLKPGKIQARKNSPEISGDPTADITLEDLGVNTSMSSKQIAEKMIQFGGIFQPIWERIAKFKNLDELKIQDISALYEEFGQQAMDSAGGFISKTEREIPENLRGSIFIAPEATGSVRNQYYTITHEFMHWVTIDSLPEAKGTESYKTLEKIYDFLNKNVDTQGYKTFQTYGLSNMNEFLAELLISNNFRTYVEGVMATNDQLKSINNDQKDLITLLIDLLKDVYAKVFGKDTKIIDEDRPLIDQASEIAVNLFFKPTVQARKSALENTKEFKLAAFVMRKKGQVPDAEIAMAIASVMPGMSPQEIKNLIDNPEQYIRDKFSYLTPLLQDNLIGRARVQNVYTPGSKTVDPAFNELSVDIDYIRQANKEKSLKDKIYGTGKQFVNKWLNPAKGLPKWVLALKDISAGGKNLDIQRAVNITQNLKKTAESIGFKDWDLFTEALKTKLPTIQMSADTAIKQWFANGPMGPATPAVMQLPAVFQQLPDEIIPYVWQMRGMIDTLTKDLIASGYVTPEQAAALESNIGEYTNRAYRLFNERGYKASKEDINNAVKFLADQYIKELATQNAGALTFEEVRDLAVDKAKKEVDDILDKKEGRFTIREDKRDTGILKEKKDIPEPIRKLMGEYTDPGTVFIMTVAKQASLKAASEYLTGLRNMGMGSIIFEKNDPNRPAGTVEIVGEGSDVLSPLNGLYATPEVYDALQTVAPTMNDITNAWMKVVGAVRWGKTVGSVVTQIKNFESNLGFAVMNGLVYTGDNTKSFQGAAKYFRGILTGKEIDEVTAKAITLGLVGQGVSATELKQMLGSGDIHNIAVDKAVSGKGPNWIIKGVTGLNKLYQLNDDFWKVYAYMNERELLSGAMFDKKYDQLTPEEQGDVDIEASERVKNTWPTYSRVWEGAKVLGKNVPIFGNFISFQAESVRVLSNTIKLAIQDLKNPQFRILGARRLAGAMSYIGLRSLITYTAANAAGLAAKGIMGAFGDDDEQQKKDGLNTALPAFMRTGDLMPIQDKKEPWKYTVYNLSSIDPYNVVFNSMNAFTDGNENTEAGVVAAGAEFLSGLLEPEMTFEAAWGIVQNRNPRTGDAITKDGDNFADRMLKRGSYLFDMLQPSTIGFAKRLAGDNPQAEGAAAFGMRPYEVDLHKSFSIIMANTGKKLEEVNKEYNRAKYNEKLSPEARKQGMQEAEDRVKYYSEKLATTYRQFLMLGADKKVLDQLIKERRQVKSSGWTPAVKRTIVTGKTQENYLK